MMEVAQQYQETNHQDAAEEEMVRRMIIRCSSVFRYTVCRASLFWWKQLHSIRTIRKVYFCLHAFQFLCFEEKIARKSLMMIVWSFEFESIAFFQIAYDVCLVMDDKLISTFRVTLIVANWYSSSCILHFIDITSRSLYHTGCSHLSNVGSTRRTWNRSQWHSETQRCRQVDSFLVSKSFFLYAVQVRFDNHILHSFIHIKSLLLKGIILSNQLHMLQQESLLK